MSAACPLPWETLVGYFAGDLARDEEDAVEEHLFACAACAREAARVAAITETIRGDIPVIVNAERVAELRRKGVPLVENPCLPGERKPAFFAPGVDLLIHRLGGLDLAGATRVDFVLRVEGSDRVLYATRDAPFDREAGAVLVACQRHYSVMPPDTVAEVRVRDAQDRETVFTYGILHRF